MGRRSIWRITKTEARAEQAMVVAEHPAAVAAGLEMLRGGGNAVDAAVTMAFVLGVVEPAASGIGGGGLMLIHDPPRGRTSVVDFAMDAPAAATEDAYELLDEPGPSRFGWRRVRGDANLFGWRAASVPGQVRGLELAIAAFGTRGLAEALAPAIRVAEGIEVSWPTGIRLLAEAALLARDAASAAVFLPDGFPLRPRDRNGGADRLVQADLAWTLRAIARRGSAAFYEGEIAQAIARGMRANDGLLTGDDLAGYRARLGDDGQALSAFGHQIIGVPGACGCFTAQEIVGILAAEPLPPSGSLDRHHVYAEASRRSFADRYRYGGDPALGALPSGMLLEPAYLRGRRAEIDLRRAGSGTLAGQPCASALPQAPGPLPPGTGGSTTHLCVVDRERRVVTLTSTLVDSFGAGVTVPGTGIVLNNAMQWLDPEPGRPNSIRPGKRGLNNMAPLLVLRDGRPRLALGSAGGVRIIDALAQVLIGVLEDGLGPSAAQGRPRIDCSGPEVLLDARLGQRIAAGLRRRGHNLRVAEESVYAHTFSRPAAIMIDDARGLLYGAADPLRPSVAAGF